MYALLYAWRGCFQWGRRRPRPLLPRRRLVHLRRQRVSLPQPAAEPASLDLASLRHLPAAPQGGTIRGTVIAGTVGKPGGVPLPGVAVTATNTLTGKKYAAATGIDGTYAMTIPHNGRYVVRAELAGFAPVTQEVMLNASDGNDWHHAREDL